MATASKVISSFSARNMKPLVDFNVAEYQGLPKLGIGLDAATVRRMHQQYSMAMDSLQPLVTTASVSTPIQFLQNWLPGFVEVITWARKSDDLIGLQITGAWEDEQVVLQVLERVGTAIPYQDWTNTPLSSWNPNFETRTVVRFEEGMKVGNLEAARAARMLVDDSGQKRQACALELEIVRNNIAFNGYNNVTATYGILNDPNALPYTLVAAGAAGPTTWATKSFLEIQRDLVTAISTLRNQSGDIIDPEKVDITLGVATVSVDYLSKTSDQGISVRAWLGEAYPRVRVVSAPQFNDAHSSANVFYLFADKVQDMSTDGGSTWIQAVPAKFQVMGVLQGPKYFEESYSNATSGAFLKRPWALTRWYGI